MWLTLLFKLLPSLATSAIQAYNKSIDASVQKYKVDGTVDIALIQAQAELVKAQRDIIVAEQGHWLTRLPRPVMGLSVSALVAKIIVWDTILQDWTHGFTPVLPPTTTALVATIVGGYFLHLTFGRKS